MTRILWILFALVAIIFPMLDVLKYKVAYGLFPNDIFLWLNVSFWSTLAVLGISGKLKIRYGLNFQIYNLVDMLSKYFSPEKTKGSVLEALPTYDAGKVDLLINQIDQTRQMTIDEIRKRGLQLQ